MRGEELVSMLIQYISQLGSVGSQTLFDAQRTSLTTTERLGQQFFSGRQDQPGIDLVGKLMAQEHSDYTERDATLLRMKDAVSHGALTTLIGKSLEQGPNSEEALGESGSSLSRVMAASVGQLASSNLPALLQLFKSGKADAAWDGYERERYVWDQPANTTAGLRSDGVKRAAVDWSYDGTPRVSDHGQNGGNRIDVRIEALDARSFLDRKEDIAEAVRQAMLTSGVFGDALGDH